MLHLVGFVDECIYIYSNYLHVTLVYNLKTNLYINKDMFYKWPAKICGCTQLTNKFQAPTIVYLTIVLIEKHQNMY